MEYEDRMEVLREVEYPKPLAEFLYGNFDGYRLRHPWARDHNVRPKSVVRDMYERSMGFSEYVAHYGVARSEGLLLRYLSDAYKALVQNVPEDAKSLALVDVTEWLGEMVRQVDSSLLDEWEMLMTSPEEIRASRSRGERPAPARAARGEPPELTDNLRAFRVMVRNACFRRAELAARRDWASLGELDGEAGWDAARWEAAFEPYFEEQPAIGTGAAARGQPCGRWRRQAPMARAPGARRPLRLPRVGRRPRRRPRRFRPAGRAGTTTPGGRAPLTAPGYELAGYGNATART